jgi:multicomponent Na+:H+ antiporter subunit G
MTIADGIGWFFMAMGIVFAVTGNLGVILFPDVYTRLQAASTCGTTATLSVILGSLFLTEFGIMTGKIIVIGVFFLFSSPVSSHIIGRYAWKKEMIPWRKVKDSKNTVGERV